MSDKTMTHLDDRTIACMGAPLWSRPAAFFRTAAITSSEGS
jgi:hypothetical protein